MSWVEQEHETRKPINMTGEREALLEEVKKDNLPVIATEADRGMKSVEAIKFQPVHSPGLFEAEFAQRDTIDPETGRVESKDVIFHFWPWGLHRAEKAGQPRPAFPRHFHERLQIAMLSSYMDAAQIKDVREMGSYFVRARGAGGQQFWYQLAVQAVTKLHHELGGS